MKRLLFIIMIYIVTGCASSQQNGDSVTSPVSLSGEGCVVLNYHRIRSSNWFIRSLAKITNNAELNIYSVYTSEFEKQMLYLKKNDIPFITPADLKAYISEQKPMPKKCALVTFDDIDVSVYEHAYPILQREQIPFSVFIITGEVGNPDFGGLDMISWKQLHEMNQSGLVTIGTHTHKLHYLEKDGTPPFVKKENLTIFKQDTLQANVTYKKHFGTDPAYFAYPFGYGIPETDRFLLSQKYELLFSLNAGLVKPNSPTFFVNRVLIEPNSWKEIEKWVNK